MMNSLSVCCRAALAAFALVGTTCLAAPTPERVALARRAAAEGIVLLKNENGALPLAKTERLCVKGPVLNTYAMCGVGAAQVNSRTCVGVAEGLRNAGFDVADDAKDVAVFVVSRGSRECFDSSNDKYGLEPTRELKALDELKRRGFGKIVVVLNTCIMISCEKLAADPAVSAVLSVWAPGMEGGNAIADVLSGAVNPSGRLACTVAKAIGDFPSTATWQEARHYVPYEEDIFVGYRYFETIPGAREKVTYPFGHGLSYTTFALSDAALSREGGKIRVRVTVTNTGARAGRHSVLCYTSATGGKADHPARELRAFAKTGLLQPGAIETLELAFDRSALAYFDDEGTSGRIGSWVVDGGTYAVYLGGDVTTAAKVGAFELEEEVLSTPGFKLDPARLARRLRADGTYSESPVLYGDRNGAMCNQKYPARDPEKKIMLQEVARGERTMDEFLDQMPVATQAWLLHGHANLIAQGNTCSIGVLKDYGVTGLQTADGPVGVRLNGKTPEERDATCFPATALAVCSFDERLMEAYGGAIGEEAASVGIDVMLAPGLCMNRNPLCGRNFEYMGEDPLLAGKMAAAYVRGVQRHIVAATLKHFAGNNREHTRLESYDVMSERAAREIYLKGFEIAVRESAPKCVMTAYNGINGRNSGENYGLLTGILRNEWGFDGVVMTDWGAHSRLWAEIAAGNDVKMPSDGGGSGMLCKLAREGMVHRDRIRESCRRVLELVMLTPRFKATLAPTDAAAAK